MITFLSKTLISPDFKVIEDGGKKHYVADYKRLYLATLADITIGIAILVIGQLSAQTSIYYTLTSVGATYAAIALISTINLFKNSNYPFTWFLFNGKNSTEALAHFRKVFEQVHGPKEKQKVNV